MSHLREESATEESFDFDEDTTSDEEWAVAYADENYILRSRGGRNARARDWKRSPSVQEQPCRRGPMKHELAFWTNVNTSGINTQTCCQLPFLDKASDAFRRDGSTQTEVGMGSPSSSASTTRSVGELNGGHVSEQARDEDCGFAICNTALMLQKREMGLGDRGNFSPMQQRHLHCYRNAMPTCPKRLVDQMDSRAYIGQYSRDGQFFVAAFQDRRVRLYDCSNDWKLRKDVQARSCRWTITDTALSPDQRFLVYASITSQLHLVNVGSNMDIVQSVANVTEVHEELELQNMDGATHRRRQSFGIWSIAWSPTASEIIAGTNDNCVYVYDMETQKCNVKVAAHDDDVNAVIYGDQDSPNIIVSGSDDTFLKVWDRRTIGQRRCKPRILIGHTEGITHMDARSDGRYVISNCKDQSIKLWDLRKARKSEAVEKLPPPDIPAFGWDYRWQAYPAKGFSVHHPHDNSIMTYHGHEVVQTLIRAYFSPMHTTGQRFIYSGSSDGCIYIYDIVTGQVVRKLRHHNVLVRDCSWHPTEPTLSSVSWDGTIVEWGPPSAEKLRFAGGGDCW